MDTYAHWTAATDTTELASPYRGAYWLRETEEIHLLDLQPPVARTTPSMWQHLRDSATAAYYPAVFAAAALLTLGIVR